VAERKIKTMEEMARTMLIEAQSSHRFWGELVYTIFYILNREKIRVMILKNPMNYGKVN